MYFTMYLKILKSSVNITKRMSVLGLIIKEKNKKRVTVMNPKTCYNITLGVKKQ